MTADSEPRLPIGGLNLEAEKPFHLSLNPYQPFASTGTYGSRAPLLQWLWRM